MTRLEQAPEATGTPTKADAVGSQVDLVLGAWQPIATLPRDEGTYLIANAEKGMVAPIVRGIIQNNPGDRLGDWLWGSAATHWMPLPAPPQSA